MGTYRRRIGTGDGIMIHRFRMHGENIVLDVNSGAVHILDELSYEILGVLSDDAGELVERQEAAVVEALVHKYNEEEITETLSEINELIKSGQLFSRDDLEDYIGDFLEERNKKPVVKALCLHIAHDCNLRCRYCFASTGDFGTKRTLMSAETGKNAIDFLIEQSGSRRNLEVDFFGGEPLMNFGAVEEIVYFIDENCDDELSLALAVGFEINDTYRCYKCIL
jgi:uncharacterized protein